MCGYEALMIQGFPMARFCPLYNDTHHWKEGRLLSLAGNAMCGFVVAVVLLGMLWHTDCQFCSLGGAMCCKALWLIHVRQFVCLCPWGR